MNVLVYRVRLLEPALVTDLEGDPNSGVSFPYLPGSTLRGVVIAKYQQAHGIKDLAGDPHARRLFFDGTTRYLNAYPLDRLDKRTAPMPLSLHREKGQEDLIQDFASENPSEGEGQQWQTVNTPFCMFSDNDTGNSDDEEDEDAGDVEPAKIRLVQPDRQINVHTARNRRFGRAVDPGHASGEDPGAVYRYDALAAGQTFEAAILCDNTEDAQVIQPFLRGEIHIGRSRSAGYGRARLELVEEEANWREVPTTNNGGKWVVTFLSDTLIRDTNGQFTIAPQTITTALEKRLDTPLSSCGGLGLNDTVFVRGRETGGFNRQWNLPLPQALAVQMGSTLVYEAPPCAPEKIRELEEQGIGERRAEGFGRIAVNWHGYESEFRLDNVSKDVSPVSVDLSRDPAASEAKVARGIVHRMLRKRLDGALIRQANELGKDIRHPKNSQLSRLRAVLQDALLQSPKEGRQRILDYLKDLDKRQSTRRQFDRDRIGGSKKQLLEWLRFRVEDETDIWQTLDVDAFPQIGGIAAEKSAKLAYEYNLRLVDAVLARAAKQNR